MHIADPLLRVVDPPTACYCILALYFLKTLEEWSESIGPVSTEEPSSHERGAQRRSFAFDVPGQASIKRLYERRTAAGNRERFDEVFRALEEANLARLAGLFTGFSFAETIPGSHREADQLLREVLERFVEPAQERDLLRRSSARGLLARRLISHCARLEGAESALWGLQVGLTDLVIGLVQPRDGESAYDPVCRPNGLLLGAAEELERQLGFAKRQALCGETGDPIAGAIVRLLLFLTNHREYDLRVGDIIQNPRFVEGPSQLSQFDVVVAALLPNRLRAGDWGQNFAQHDPYGRFRRGIPARGHGESAYLLHMIESMSPHTGRMAGVFSRGVLFRGAGEEDIRRSLIQENLLDAVIALPERTLFENRSSVVLLVFRRRRDRESVLFIDASQDFDRRRSYNELTPADVQRVLDAYAAWDDVPGYARVVSPGEIEANGFNLYLPRYVKPVERPMRSQDELVAEHRVLLGELESVSSSVNELIAELTTRT
ncbi:N-6 DNA methylase [Ectothiorhodospiraceae bacterium WFHF3C12]|nr:N-6 DNA methylase [Ectothiorhodospiraceae bacterium WFHF3C12]